MTSRPRLLTSIPFWVLFVGSLALTGLGVWLVLDKLGAMESGLTDESATAADVYVGQPAAVIGGIVLGAGLVGLLLTLTVATLRTLLPEPAAEVIEAIDWTSDDESAEADAVLPVATVTAAPVAAAATAATAPAEVAPATESAPAASTADSEPPAVAFGEEPDIEQPADAPAPADAADAAADAEERPER